MYRMYGLIAFAKSPMFSRTWPDILVLAFLIVYCRPRISGEFLEKLFVLYTARFRRQRNIFHIINVHRTIQEMWNQRIVEWSVTIRGSCVTDVTLVVDVTLGCSFRRQLAKKNFLSNTSTPTV